MYSYIPLYNVYQLSAVLGLKVNALHCNYTTGTILPDIAVPTSAHTELLLMRGLQSIVSTPCVKGQMVLWLSKYY